MSVPAARTSVVPYDPAWAERGAALADELMAALAPLALRAEHIGSTSVPGLAAKEIFDLQVSVADLEEAADAFDAPLAELGFVRQPYEQDHVPAGSGDDPAGWAKRNWSRRGHPEGDVNFEAGQDVFPPRRDGERRAGAEGDVNLHVRLRGSPNERLALLFRDWFRAHPAAIPAYTEFKLALAEVVDRGTYTDVKDPVVDLVIAVAEEWAAATGWSSD